MSCDCRATDKLSNGQIHWLKVKGFKEKMLFVPYSVRVYLHTLSLEANGLHAYFKGMPGG